MRLLTSVVLVAFITGLSGCDQKIPARNNRAENDPSALFAKPVEATDLVRGFATFYQQRQSAQVDYEQQLVMEQNGKLNAMGSTAKITIERPNRIAIRQMGAPHAASIAGAEISCDGKQLTISLPSVKQYSQSPAPDSIDELLTNPLVNGGGAGRGPLLDLFASDPYKTLMEGVTNVSYISREKVDDIDTHHLKFVQEEFDWELWFVVDSKPLLVKTVFDMSKTLAAAGEQFKNTKLTVTQRYKNWKFDFSPPAEDFAFVPSEGAKKVENFFNMDGEDTDELSPLIGKQAPDIEQKLLDGESFSLKQLKDKKIVILDFWATWCGPCVQEMPIIAKVAEEYREKDVELFCVNQQEDADTIREFLKEKSLNVTVSLDSEREAGEAYGASAIPMLVLIDKPGIVQSVHVGFNPKIGEILKQELDAVIAGESIAVKSETADPSDDANMPTEGLQQVWSHPGRYSSVSVPADGKTIVALKGTVADFFDTSGNVLQSIKLDAVGQILRSARLMGNDPGELLLFGVWAIPLTAISSDGVTLWTEASGIDDVWAADLDGDGKDEVIVGYNGGGGVHVFGGNGKRLWKSSAIGNVWHVTAGDMVGDGHLEVVTTSAAGKVHLFDADGKMSATLDPGIYAHMVRTFRLSDDSADGVLVAGGDGKSTQMVAMNGKGVILWKIDFPSGSKHCDSLAFARGTRWAAAGIRDGSVYVIDVDTGKFVAVGPKQGLMSEVGWSNGDGEPLLLIASSSGLSAWHVKPSADGAK